MIKIRISKNNSSVELWVKSVTINACEIELTFYEEDYYDKSDHVFFERNYEAICKLGIIGANYKLDNYGAGMIFAFGHGQIPSIEVLDIKHFK